MIGKEPFIGFECEGTDSEKGKRTLFIPNNASCLLSGDEELYNKLITNSGITRFYFGAGNQRGFSFRDTILMQRLIKHGYQVLCEIDVHDLQSMTQVQGCEFILVLDSNHIPMHIKFVGDDALCMYPLNDGKVTGLKNKEYQRDVSWEVY